MTACGGGGNGAYLVSGTVTTPQLQGGNTPVAGVLVSLQSVLTIVDVTRAPIQITELATTGAQGTFSFRAQPGKYMLQGEKTGFVFSSFEVDVAGADLPRQEIFAFDEHLNYLTGVVEGAAAPGVTVAVTGPVSSSTTTDAFGEYAIGPLPVGQFTVTASAPSISFFPQSFLFTSGGFEEADFLSTPQAAQATVTVAGDAASGIDGGTFPSIPKGSGASPVPSVALYDPASDIWSFTLFFPGTPNNNGDFGGTVTLNGRPAPGAFTAANQSLHSADFGRCWLGSGSTPSVWNQHDYSLTLTSVGPAAPFLPLPASGTPGAFFYPIHGSLHVNCTGSAFDGSSLQPIPGSVTVDATF